MTSVESYLEKRLQEWALWFIKQADFGAGYSQCSLESRLQDSQGFFVQKRNKKQYIPYSPSAIELDELITKLSQHQTLLADVLRADYIQPGTQHSKAASLGMSLAQFKICNKLAKMWLYGHISAIMSPRFHSNCP